ncbi:MAG: cell division protein FtsA [Candidatus Colwellbacteria bacterium]|nr:cell division protein FtsA [Candidatus Colwellbacteria bacterium]
MAQAAILGLDIGSETVKAVVAESGSGGRMVLRASFNKPSEGLRRGVVVDMEATAGVVRSLLSEVRQIDKSALKNIYLRVGGADVKVQSSRGITAVSRANAEIFKDDIDRVVQSAQALNLPSNRMILHTLNQEFIVDGIGDIEDPLGMTGARLELISLIVDAFEPPVKNLTKTVTQSGGSIGGLVFGPLAAATAVLTKNQKELGTILIDIGFGTTGIAVYEENKLLHTKVLPVGAGHITNDLAYALKVPVEVAEKIKLSYGYALSREVSGKEKVELKKFDEKSKGEPSRKYIAEVIEIRLSEICDLIGDELRTIGREKLPGGAVITGGGVKLPGIVELIKQELKVSTQIGLPRASDFEADSPTALSLLEAPEYALVLGLVLSSVATKRPRRESLSRNPIINFLKNLIP